MTIDISPNALTLIGMFVTLIGVIVMGIVGVVGPIKLEGKRADEWRQTRDEDRIYAKQVETEAKAERRRVAEELERVRDAAKESGDKFLETQQQLAQQGEAAAALLAENTRIAADASKELRVTVDQVHVLVNSTLTAAKQASLKAKQKALERTELGIDRARRLGEQPSTEELSDVELLQGEIADLEHELAVRTAQQDVVDMTTEQRKLAVEDG